jgi:phosphate-selective porin OprO/OprP
MQLSKFRWSAHLRRAGAIAALTLALPALGGAQNTLVQSPYQQPAAPMPAQLVLPAAPVVPVQQPAPPTTPASPESAATKALAREVFQEEKQKEAEAKKAADEGKARELEEKGFRVGSNLNLTTRWNVASGFTAETPNKDFFIHLGGRFQFDSVWWDQSPNSRSSKQMGNFQDGFFFRRVRIQFDGQAYEVVEWNFEYALEQVTQGIPNLDEMWVGVWKLPIIGSIRAGHMKVPQGFEGDMVSSSKAMTFLERSAFTDAFYQNFAPGIWTGNSVLNQRVTWAAMWYRQENQFHGSNGADFGDGEYAMSARLTGLPIYENDGRCLLHLGASISYRNSEKPDPGLAGPGVVRFRARPQLRDAIGDFGNFTFPTNGTLPATQLPGNTTRLVDTGNITSSSNTVAGTELFYVHGPFSLQAEWAFAWANGTVVGGHPRGELGFNGGYIEASYFLTGENRIYDRRLGREGSTYIAAPYTPFWAVRDEDGRLNIGWGAWELATRWNYLNLNDGPVQGGILQGFEAGINWYLTTNLKFQVEYLNEERYHRPGQVSGWVNGIGTRIQMFF